MAARKALNGFELMLRHYEPSNEENKVVFLIESRVRRLLKPYLSITIGLYVSLGT